MSVALASWWLDQQARICFSLLPHFPCWLRLQSFRVDFWDSLACEPEVVDPALVISVCVCVLAGSAFCTLFCFGLVCVCVFCFASFVLIWSVCVFWLGLLSVRCFVLVWCVCVLFCFFCFDLVCVCVLAGSAFCTSFCFVWCRLVRVCVVCRLSCCFFVFCVMGWFGFFALLWLVPVWCGVWGGQVLRKPCFQVWPLKKLALTTVTTCF